MKDTLQAARAEILGLRRRNQLLEAKMEVVEAFSAALGLRSARGIGDSVDVVMRIEQAVAELEAAQGIDTLTS